MSRAGEIFVTVQVSLTDAAMCISSIYIIYSMTHIIFPGVSATPGSHRPNVWSIEKERVYWREH